MAVAKDFLKEIIDYKKNLLKEKRAYLDGLKRNIDKTSLTRYGLFKQAIARPGKINLIAEIKKASPSQGLIRDDFNVEQLARIYVANGAAALSVLTEDKFFLGKPLYLKKASEVATVPVLRKDFILDEGEIYEAFTFGASALLLIAAILDDATMKRLLETASKLDMDCLVEVHDEAELKRALENGAEIIGINNRNLHTFEVNLKVSERLIPKIPKGKVIVAESGISRHEEVMKLKDLGAHAVLIGETFIRSPDVGKKVREVMEGK